VTVHFSTRLDDGTWLVELREPAPGHGRVTDACPGDRIALQRRASLTLLSRYPDPGADRLWTASFSVPSSGRAAADAASPADAASTADGEDGDVGGYLARHGRPIRYSYVPEQWPLPAYQTVFSREPGSAEMPSAGRPLTPDLVLALITSGVILAPITLHAGVASLEAGELPLPERFTVPEPTAALVNLTRSAGRRVVAVGTTVTRALVSAADAAADGEGGLVRASSGWTDLLLGADRPARVVTGLVTGWHDPEASHLALLETVAGPALVRAAYAEADKADYLGHEFGDSCLLLPALPAPSR
jgi:S-adenosylmethionine:tRNA ribosyltransferase-isomerase